MQQEALLTEWAQHWVTYLRQRRRSTTTINTAESIVQAFLDWLAANNSATTPSLLTLATLEDYVIYLRDERVTVQQARKAQHAAPSQPLALKHSSIRNYVSVLTRWLQWLTDRGRISAIPDYDGTPIQPPAIRDQLERLLDRREPLVAPRMPNLQRLPGYYELQLKAFVATHGVPTAKQAAPFRAYLNLLRNRAFIALLFASGGRVAEVLSIPSEDVRHGSNVMYRIPILGKGRKRRSLRVDDLARSWIAEYLDARATAYPTATALFISHGPKANGKQMSAVSAWRVVKEAALWLSDIRAGEGADSEELQRLRAISPHSLRHFLAQALLDEGAEYKDIAALLGHSSTTVTEQVYARQHEEITHEIADTFAPRAIMPDIPGQQKRK